jgi:hypothetical protein
MQLFSGVDPYERKAGSEIDNFSSSHYHAIIRRSGMRCNEDRLGGRMSHLRISDFERKKARKVRCWQ